MKKKILSFLSTLALAFTITGCGKKARTITTEPNYDYFDTLKEISDIKITNVPKQIQIGYITQANIILEISYADGTKDEKLITESFFPKNFYSELLTEGNKYFDFVYKEKHIPLKFKLVKAKVPMTYKVDFVNEQGNIIETKYVKYLNSVICSRSHAINDYFDDDYFYKFTGTFDHQLDYVYENFTAKPVFEKYKSSHFDNKYYYNAATYDTISTYKDSGENPCYHTLVYVGRVKDFVVCPLNYTYIREKYEEVDQKYNKEQQVDAFYTNISKKLKDYIHRCYDHTETNEILSDVTFTNKDYLDFDLSVESDYSGFEFDIKLPDCFLGDLSETKYELPPDKRRKMDGQIYSFKSLFSKESASLHKVEYNIDQKTESYFFTQEYDKGYYDLNFVLDLDLYLDVSYYANITDNICSISLDSVKFAAAFIENTGRFEINYCSNPTFEYYGNKFSVENNVLANTLLEEVKKTLS